VKCATKYCRGITTKGGKSPYCGKCRSKKWKAKNPLRYYYNALKQRAKQRGKEFKLTFEEYRKLAIESGYHERRGRGALCLSLDRIDNDKGYEIGNLRAITVSENSMKGQRQEWMFREKGLI